MTQPNNNNSDCQFIQQKFKVKRLIRLSILRNFLSAECAVVIATSTVDALPRKFSTLSVGGVGR